MLSATETLDVDCISCGEPMKGIRTHEARRICEPCGGRSLCECSKDVLARRQAQREGQYERTG